MASGNDSDRYHAEDSGYTKNAGDVWAPSGVSGGMTGVSVLSFVLGVISVVLAVASARPFLCWLFAAIAIIAGLRVFLPRVTTLDKILIGIGVLASVVAIVILIVGS
jgi:hypothetical protein